jgi:class 3 adenylate cyclase/tetratricopeptide (TPR) repeat protein
VVGGAASGRAWTRAVLTCAACLHVAPPGARFCPECGATLSLASQFAQAERRQVSVMFADIVDYTEIAARLDPEELRTLIHSYQARVAQAVKEYGGFVSRYIGDGVMAYFGWPLAGEIDAESAVRAAFAAKWAFRDYGTRPERLRVRIAVATGLVVIEEGHGTDAARYADAFGETPNRAARLQSLAETDGIIIDDATRQQIGALFDCQDMGLATLKGFPTPIRAWRVLSELSVSSRFEALHDGPVSPMVGRDAEFSKLLGLWDKARQGRGQLALVIGEPGIGKSRLIVAVEQRLATTRFACLRFFCVRDRQHSALNPVIATLTNTAGFGTQDTPEDKVRKLRSALGDNVRDDQSAEDEEIVEDVALIADLMSVPIGDHRVLNYSPQRRKERTFAVLVRILVNAARVKPLLVTFEDMHWADPTTIELLDQVMQILDALPIMLVLTFRPNVNLRWVGHPSSTLLTLRRLTTEQAALLASQVSQDAELPPHVLNLIVAQSDGVPLFIEELTKTILAQSGPFPKGGETIIVPPTLRASLMARLDRLPRAKLVAQVGSAIGREFLYTLLFRVASLPESVLAAGLDELVDAGFVFLHVGPSGPVYTFKHALVQEAAYQSLLRTRRAEIHAAISQELEQNPGVEGPQPALLGYHCAQAGLIEKAANYYRLAGEQSVARAALAETRALLDRGISLADALPDGPESRRLRAEAFVSLGRILHMTRSPSDPEALATFDQAIDLAHGVPHPEPMVRALLTRFLNLWRRGSYIAAKQDAERLIDVGRDRNDPSALILGHVTQGYIHSILGRFSEANTDIETASTLVDRQPDVPIDIGFGRSVLTNGLIFGAFSLGCLGHIDRAMADAAGILRRIEALTPFARASGLLLLSRFAFITRDKDSYRLHTNTLMQISDMCGFTDFVTAAKFGQGWLAVTDGRIAQGLEEMHASMTAMQRSEYRAFGPYWRLMMADALTRAGQTTAALGAVEEALLLSSRTGEAWLDAELHRQKGNLLLQEATIKTTMAESSFQTAMMVSRRQRAKFFELRAVTDLARVWAAQGRRTDAHRLLQHTCSWFDHATNAADFTQANELLVELATNSAS